MKTTIKAERLAGLGWPFGKKFTLKRISRLEALNLRFKGRNLILPAALLPRPAERGERTEERGSFAPASGSPLTGIRQGLMGSFVFLTDLPTAHEPGKGLREAPTARPSESPGQRPGITDAIKQKALKGRPNRVPISSWFKESGGAK
jgi:hypothetical protein